MKTFLSKMAKFQSEATLESFKQIYGELLGEHIWKKFVRNNYQIPLQDMDPNTMLITENHINESNA